MGLLKDDIRPVFIGREVAMATKVTDEPEVPLEELIKEAKKEKEDKGESGRKITDYKKGNKETRKTV